MRLLRKPQGEMREHIVKNGDGSDLRFLTFPGFEALEERGFLRHCFSTREGGVSKGIYESMDLSFKLGDDIDDVYENFDRLAAVIGTTKDRIVSTDQQHTATVIRVTGEDAGKGVTIRPGFDSVDGLVTCEKDLALVVYGSDCVPVMFADPVREAIGVCHAGWKGTAGRIAQNAVEMMAREFGTDPKDLVCGIGPSVCADCYEVSEDVALIFMKEFSGREEEVIKDSYAQGTEMKYKLDLWAANRIILEEAGVSRENIDITDICTHCNPDLLFSHRAAGILRGNNAGLIIMPGRQDTSVLY